MRNSGVLSMRALSTLLAAGLALWAVPLAAAQEPVDLINQTHVNTWDSLDNFARCGWDVVYLPFVLIGNNYEPVNFVRNRITEQETAVKGAYWNTVRPMVYGVSAPLANDLDFYYDEWAPAAGGWGLNMTQYAKCLAKHYEFWSADALIWKNAPVACFWGSIFFDSTCGSSVIECDRMVYKHVFDTILHLVNPNNPASTWSPCVPPTSPTCANEVMRCAPPPCECVMPEPAWIEDVRV